MANTNEVETLWDYEDTWVPDNYDLSTLRPNIQISLSKVVGLNLVIRGKVKAFGPGNGHKHSQLIRHPQDIEVIAFPQVNKTCDGVKDTRRCGVGIVVGSTSEQIMRKTDVADKYIMLRMICESLDGRTLLLITGNGDFARLIRKLKPLFPRLRIMVAYLPNSIQALRSCGHIAWIWSREGNDGNQDVMINGGEPVNRTIRQG